MILNTYIWDLYKKSELGRKAITAFNIELVNPSFIAYAKQCNNLLCESITDINLIEDLIETFYCYNLTEGEIPTTVKEATETFACSMKYGIREGGSIDYFVKRDDYKSMLHLNSAISFAMYVFAPEFYFPNFFQGNFQSLTRTFDLFEIDIPAIPKKSDYKARCMYYMALCEVLYKFRIENNLSPAELCAFLYDFAPNMQNQNINNAICRPTQAWFIGGKMSEQEYQTNYLFWQANEDTRKGDIILFYETAPKSAITSIWIAQTNGVRDPFFHYYNYAYIGDKKEINPITLPDLKAHPTLSELSVVRKNFQGVNGFPINSSDYQQILSVANQKGDNIATLPKLYSPDIKPGKDCKLEKEVEEKLLEPLLKELGIKQSDYSRQMSTHAGRGNRVYSDYTLFFNDLPGNETANILIEVKLLMRSNKEINNAFNQAYSYAKLFDSKLIILCDKEKILIFEKGISFNREVWTQYDWSQINTPDAFRQMQNLIFKYSKK